CGLHTHRMRSQRMIPLGTTDPHNWFIRIPFVSCRDRDSADPSTSRPEPISLLPAPLGFSGIANTFQSEFVSVPSLTLAQCRAALACGM
ncbi:hypothetical protein ACI3L1_11250, partial [Deinococcus sp. SM5_A1]|uniref:hypothetical protein n=1 Tax=Deinococcus sp. SM5_A1 TaxID=3379094 RepID=UPI00385A9786